MGKGSSVLCRARTRVVELFGADLRSLAVFRVVLAILVLFDLASRAPDLYAHYTDAGVLPRSVLLEVVLENRWAYSLNFLSGELFFQALLFGLAAVAALGLLVGYRTRLMTVVVWVLLVSIQWRNPLVLNAGDTLLRMLLFWAMFLPLGAYWSVDRALKPVPPRLSMRFLWFGTVGLFLQIAFVYWFSALLKSGPGWHVDGTAIYYALSVEEWTTPIGAYLYQFPELLKVLTFATIGLEGFGPFLLFFPFFTGPVRTTAVLAFMALHYGIWSTMPIGVFSWVAAFCMVCFLPGWFWEKALPKLRAAFLEAPDAGRGPRPRAARLVRACWLPLRARSFSAAGTGAPRQSEGRAVAEDAGEREIRPGPAAGPEPVTLRSSLATNLLALSFLLYVFCWNLMTVSEFRMPQSLVPPGSLLGLKQNWGVFAPEPRKIGGWYVIPGTLSSGEQVDLMGAAVRKDFDLREVSWQKPKNVPGALKNKYWRKYLSALQEADEEDLREYFGRYVCREWNARHWGAEQLTSLRIVLVQQATLPDYRRTAPQGVVLLERSCS